LYFQENHVTKYRFCGDVICLDFHFLHFPYKLIINWTSGDGQNIQKSPKMTILWKNITKAINNQRKSPIFGRYHCQ